MHPYLGRGYFIYEAINIQLKIIKFFFTFADCKSIDPYIQYIHNMMLRHHLNRH